jgi:beta-N-acetylhexosaminidase
MYRLKQVLVWLTFALLVTGVSGCWNTKVERENYAPLTEQEINLIDDYIKQTSVRDEIGQLLMVGVPADINTAEDSDSKALDALIGDLGVGMVIVNGYNYYDSNKSADDKEYLTRVINFNNLLQRKTRKSKSKFPLLVASDFEGPSFPSIKRGLVLPPSALSLSTTQDGQLIRDVGRYIGTELTNVGIHIILGPVLDTYNIKQGNKNILQDRCFAATSEGVARTASHYISGLNESGIVVFAKHYPGHGSIESDPHQEIIPIYEGSKEQLGQELLPFIQSKDSVRGIMTSHIQLANSKTSGLATFSQEIVGDIGKKGLDKKVIITDDLSDMGAIRKYMADTGKTYQDVAINAFDAGHDVLLFSHISDEQKQSYKFGRTYKASKFTLKDLSLVQEKLIEHIESSEIARKRFNESLRKVLILKAQVARLKSSEQLNRLFQKIEGNDTAFNFQTTSDGRLAIENTEKGMAKDQFNNVNVAGDIPESGLGNWLVKSSIRKSVIWINRKDNIDINLLNRSEDTKIIFAVYEDHLEKFRTAFSSRFTNATYLRIPIRKETDAFAKLEKDIDAKFGNSAVLIYTARDSSDADLLKRLRNKYKKDYSSRVIVFCHNSPAIFDNDILSDSTVIGNFSMHPFSFDVNVELLSGSTEQPRELTNIPVNIGDNGKFYNVSSTKWVEPANPAIFGELFPQQSVLASRSSLEKQYFLIPRPSQFELWTDYFGKALILVAIAMFAWLLHQGPRLYLSHGGAPKATLKVLADRKVGVVIAATAFLLLFLVAFYDSLFSNYISNVERTSSQIRKVYK